MLIGGLWHGAAWTFVVWGGLHGLYLIGERVANRLVGHWLLWQRRDARLFLALLTFALVCLAWIFFRADSFDRAFALTAASFGFGPAQLSLPLLDLAIIGLTVGGLMVLHGLLRNTTLEQAAERLHWSVLSLLLAGMLTAIALTPSEDRAFIYFQF